MSGWPVFERVREIADSRRRRRRRHQVGRVSDFACTRDYVLMNDESMSNLIARFLVIAEVQFIRGGVTALFKWPTMPRIKGNINFEENNYFQQAKIDMFMKMKKKAKRTDDSRSL